MLFPGVFEVFWVQVSTEMFGVVSSDQTFVPRPESHSSL